jgi:hypothetical protein
MFSRVKLSVALMAGALGFAGFVGSASATTYDYTVAMYGTATGPNPSLLSLELTGSSLSNSDSYALTGTLDGVTVDITSGLSFNFDKAGLSGINTFINGNPTNNPDSTLTLINFVTDGGTYTFSYDCGRFSCSKTDSGVYSITAAVPEPSTWAMLVLGFAGVGFMAYRRNKSQTTFRVV